MLNVYPLRPVVSDEPRWKAAYDAHPASIDFASACVSSLEAGSLLAQGAEFEAVVLLDGAGERFAEDLAARQAALHADRRTLVVRLSLPGSEAQPIERIHRCLEGEALSGFFEAAGG